MQNIEEKLSAMDDMPSNLELLERTRSSTDATPVNDMWQIVNVKKRLDAAEVAITKVSLERRDRKGFEINLYWENLSE